MDALSVILTADVMVSHLGFKTRTGPANRTLAALRQYGLLEKVGKNYAVSERAWKALILPDEAPERMKLIQEIALRPALFRELLGLYPDGLPSDATLRSYLILNKGFNENTVGQFIKVFKAAIDIAKPFDNGYTADDYSDNEDDEESEDFNEEASMETSASQPVSIKTPPLQQPQPHSKERAFSFPLSFQRGVNAVVTIHGDNLKRRDLEVLEKKVRDLIDAWEDEEEAQKDE